MYKYLKPKNEIQVPDVNCPHVRGEQFTLCKRTKHDISNLQERANSIKKKFARSEIVTNPLHGVRGGREFPRHTNCRAPEQTPQLSSCLNQVGRISIVPNYP